MVLLDIIPTHKVMSLTVVALLWKIWDHDFQRLATFSRNRDHIHEDWHFVVYCKYPLNQNTYLVQ